MLNLTPFTETDSINTLERLARQLGRWLRETNHSEIWIQAIRNEPFLNTLSDKIITRQKFDVKFKFQIPPRED